MSGSHPDGKKETLDFVLSNDIETILDVGPGKGTYFDLIQNKKEIFPFDAIEVWEPYVDKYELTSKYDRVFVEDVRNWSDFDYDLVILGDILEHMTKEEALAVWEKISQQATHAVISIPIIHYPQGESEGNPYQVHVKEDWTTEEVLNTFSNITAHKEFPVVGLFFATF